MCITLYYDFKDNYINIIDLKASFCIAVYIKFKFKLMDLVEI